MYSTQKFLFQIYKFGFYSNLQIWFLFQICKFIFYGFRVLYSMIPVGLPFRKNTNLYSEKMQIYIPKKCTFIFREIQICIPKNTNLYSEKM